METARPVRDGHDDETKQARPLDMIPYHNGKTTTIHVGTLERTVFKNCCA